VVSPAQNAKPRSGFSIGIGMIVLLCMGVMLLVSPWTLHMGGRPTPSLIWHGYGKLGSTKGVDSLLFVELNALSRGSQKAGKRAGFTRSDNIGGTAIVCTDKGERIPFDVRGGVDAWMDADRKPMVLHLTAPRNSTKHYSAMLYGEWLGGELGLSDHGTLASLLSAEQTKKGSGTNLTDRKAGNPVERSAIIQYARGRDFDEVCGANGGNTF
jgi:hypothetical protein